MYSLAYVQLKDYMVDARFAALQRKVHRFRRLSKRGLEYSARSPAPNHIQAPHYILLLSPRHPADRRQRRRVLQCGRVDARAVQPNRLGEACIDEPVRGLMANVHVTRHTGVVPFLSSCVTEGDEVGENFAQEENSFVGTRNGEMQWLFIFDEACGSTHR